MFKVTYRTDDCIETAYQGDNAKKAMLAVIATKQQFAWANVVLVTPDGVKFY